MTLLKIAEHAKALDELAAEGLAAIERAYEDAMAHIASLADGGTAPPVEDKQARDSRADDAPTVAITVRAA